MSDKHLCILPLLTTARDVLQVTAIQSYSKNFLGRALQPLEMRELLASTGLPQGDPEQGDIGPFIQMRSAIEALQQQSLN